MRIKIYQNPRHLVPQLLLTLSLAALCALLLIFVNPKSERQQMGLAFAGWGGLVLGGAGALFVLGRFLLSHLLGRPPIEIDEDSLVLRSVRGRDRFSFADVSHFELTTLHNGDVPNSIIAIHFRTDQLRVRYAKTSSLDRVCLTHPTLFFFAAGFTLSPQEIADILNLRVAAGQKRPLEAADILYNSYLYAKIEE